MLGEKWQDPVDITKEQWMAILEERDIIKEKDAQLLKLVYTCNNCEATALQLAHILRMPHHGPINLQVGFLGKRIVKKLNIQAPRVHYSSKRGEEFNWWHVPFLGESRKEGFYWILRPELQEAMHEMQQEEMVFVNGA